MNEWMNDFDLSFRCGWVQNVLMRHSPWRDFQFVSTGSTRIKLSKEFKIDCKIESSMDIMERIIEHIDWIFNELFSATMEKKVRLIYCNNLQWKFIIIRHFRWTCSYSLSCNGFLSHWTELNFQIITFHVKLNVLKPYFIAAHQNWM